MLRDVAYGDDPRQRFDVYLPALTKNAPAIFLAHGGGWAYGNKDNPGLVDDKAAYWLPKGYVLISADYRLLPAAAPLDQARDVGQMMELPRIPSLYHRAFGKDRAYRISVSPYHALTRRALPMLAVCSSRRPDACPQARALSTKAAPLGVRVQVLPEDLSHLEINRALGQRSAYTEAVDAFLQSLEPR